MLQHAVSSLSLTFRQVCVFVTYLISVSAVLAVSPGWCKLTAVAVTLAAALLAPAASRTWPRTLAVGVLTIVASGVMCILAA